MLERLFRRLTGREDPRGQAQPRGPHGSWGLVGDVSNPRITEQTVNGISTAYRCVGRVADAVAGVRWEARPGVDADGLLSLLNDSPNNEMSSFSFWHSMTASRMIWGFALAEIERRNGGTPIALWPIEPDRVQVRRDAANRLVFEVTNPNGSQTMLSAQNALYIPDRTLYDGVTPLSPVAAARRSLGLTASAEQYGANFYGNGARASLHVDLPEAMSEETFERHRQAIGRFTTGASQHGILVTESGAKVSSISFPPEDAQYLGTRRFQREEVCMWFGLRASDISDPEKPVFSSVEQVAIDFVMRVLQPEARRLECEVERKLSPGAGLRMDIDAVVKADISARFAANKTAIDAGFMTPAEVRDREGLPPMGGGEQTETDSNEQQRSAVAFDPTESLRPLVDDLADRITTRASRAGEQKSGRDGAGEWASSWLDSHEAWSISQADPVARAAQSMGLDPADLYGVVGPIRDAWRDGPRELGSDTRAAVAELILGRLTNAA